MAHTPAKQKVSVGANLVVQRSLKQTKTEMPYDSAIPSLGMYPEKM